jgi:hypothetical protein
VFCNWLLQQTLADVQVAHCTALPHAVLSRPRAVCSVPSPTVSDVTQRPANTFLTRLWRSIVGPLLYPRQPCLFCYFRKPQTRIIVHTRNTTAQATASLFINSKVQLPHQSAPSAVQRNADVRTTPHM